MKHYDYSTFPWDTYRVMTASDCPAGSEQEWLFCAAVDFAADGMDPYPALVKAEGMLREVGMTHGVDNLRLLVRQAEKWGKARANWLAYNRVERDAHALRQNQWVGTGSAPVPQEPPPMVAPEAPVVVQQGVGQVLDPELEWRRGLAQEDYAALVDLAAGELELYRTHVGKWTKRLRIARAGVGD